MRSVSSSGLSAWMNGTHPALSWADVSALVRAAHQRPVSLSQTPQRPPKSASMAPAVAVVALVVFLAHGVFRLQVAVATEQHGAVYCL